MPVPVPLEVIALTKESQVVPERLVQIPVVVLEKSGMIARLAMASSPPEERIAGVEKTLSAEQDRTAAVESNWISVKLGWTLVQPYWTSARHNRTLVPLDWALVQPGWSLLQLGWTLVAPDKPVRQLTSSKRTPGILVSPRCCCELDMAEPAC